MKRLNSILLLMGLSFGIWASPDLTVKLQRVALGTSYVNPFQVNVTFNEPVTGFGKSEMNVTNALINSISPIIGSKTHYVIYLSPKNPGPMTVQIPGDVVRSTSSGALNKPSNTLKIMALDPDLNPSANFDLSAWNLVLPLPLGDIGGAIQISSNALVGDASLNTGYTNPPYFYTDGVIGTLNFFAPLNGATTQGSVFPRSGLSENLQERGLPATWKLSSFDSSMLKASLIVTQVPPSKRIVIGELQDKGNMDDLGQEVGKKDLVKIYYDLNQFDPNNRACNGCIYALIRPAPANDRYLQTLTFAKDILLNKPFIYKITLLRDGTLTVQVDNKSFKYNLNTSIDNTIGWGSQELFFKAGVTLLENGTSSFVGGMAKFFSLEVAHKGCPFE